MLGTSEAAAIINKLLGDEDTPHHQRIHAGTLCVFGDWFGRPHDNWHSPVSAHASGKVLTIRFDAGETLTVWDPGLISISPREFIIRHASHVRWEWFAYGRAYERISDE